MPDFLNRNILLVTLVLLGAHLRAQPILLSNEIKTNENISSHVMFFEDATGEMALEEVLKRDFVKNEDNTRLILPFSNHAFWFKMDFVKGEGASEDWTIWFTNELTENIELYEYSLEDEEYVISGEWDILTSRTNYFKGQEPFFDFKLRDSSTIYVKIKSQRALSGFFSVGPSSGKAGVIMELQGQRAFVNGLLIFRLLLVLTLGLFVIKNVAFRAYSLLILIKTLGYWGLINALTPASVSSPLVAQKLNYLFYSSTPIGTVLFSFAVLPFFGLPSWIKKVLYLFVGLTVGVNILVQLNYTWKFLEIGVGVSVFSGLFIALVFAYSAMKRLPVQKYYAIPFLLGLLSYILMNIRILFEVEIPLISNITFFLFAAEILVFIFFLGRIFRESQLKHLLVKQELENEAIQSKRLKELNELKSNFFTNVSHELKTPLTLIEGPINELSKKYPKDSLLKLIKPNVNRLKQLMYQILEVQKLEAGKVNFNIQKEDLAKYFKLHVFSFESLAESCGVRMEFQQNADEYFAYFDKDKLDKIMDNLISNAIKYNQKGGKVKIKVVYDEKPQKLNITVADTGLGISEKDLPMIFDRFFQANNSSLDGTGVGLSLVKELVAVLKGTIEVKSKENQGTEFLLTIPVDELTWAAHLPKLEAVDKSHAGVIGIQNEALERSTDKELLLLVEDNHDMQEYLKILFEDYYEIIQAYNGAEGIEKAKQEVPDLIVCDLMMPVMDGFEFSRNIRANEASSHVPIIMLTAKSSKESRLEGLEIGVDLYMTKPFDADELKASIRSCIENRKTQRSRYKGKVLDEEVSEEVEVNAWEKEFMDKLKTILEEHYQDSNIGVQKIAGILEMSDSQLRRKLKSISSYTPNEFIRKYRLEKAEMLLKDGSKSVSEIAFEVGFESLSYFSKRFHKEYGCLPSEYLDRRK